MGEVKTFLTIPDAMTYPQILHVIYEKLQNRLELSNFFGIGGE